MNNYCSKYSFWDPKSSLCMEHSTRVLISRGVEALNRSPLLKLDIYLIFWFELPSTLSSSNPRSRKRPDHKLLIRRVARIPKHRMFQRKEHRSDLGNTTSFAGQELDSGWQMFRKRSVIKGRPKGCRRCRCECHSLRTIVAFGIVSLRLGPPQMQSQSVSRIFYSFPSLACCAFRILVLLGSCFFTSTFRNQPNTPN